MAGRVTVMVRALARADQIESTAAMLRELARHSRAEPGCLSYAILQGAGAPAEFVLVEQWRDEAALAEHMQTAHVAAAFAQVPRLLETAPERGAYLTVG
jgi:quinol monooxygenase YgiN